MITAKKIEGIVKTEALHVLYREDGRWYHHLKKFPGVLFDYCGYIIFKTEKDYKSNTFLTHRQDLNVKGGISSFPNYIKFDKAQVKEIEKLQIDPRDVKMNKKEIFKTVQSDLNAYEEENSIDFEGGLKKRLVSYYERNINLRTRAIEIHGTTCKVCQFNFEEVYGAHGIDYVEVHHLIPIHTLLKATQINPETDMTVLCANCHRMVHRKKNKPLTIFELRKLRENAQRKKS